MTSAKEALENISQPGSAYLYQGGVNLFVSKEDLDTIRRALKLLDDIETGKGVYLRFKRQIEQVGQE